MFRIETQNQVSVLDSGKRLFWHFLGDIWDLSNSNKKRFTCRAASAWPNSSSRGMESIMLTLNLPFAFPSSLPPESSLPSRGDRFPHTAVQELLAQADSEFHLSDFTSGPHYVSDPAGPRLFIFGRGGRGKKCLF